MRWYFLWGLIASLVMSLVLFVLMITSLRRNWNHTNRSVVSYFLPSLLAILLVYLAASQLVPRVFDAVQIVYGQYDSTEVTLSGENFEYNRIIAEDQVYYYPPSHFKNMETGRYQIYFTERTNYVMNIIFIGETDDVNENSVNSP